MATVSLLGKIDFSGSSTFSISVQPNDCLVWGSMVMSSNQINSQSVYIPSSTSPTGSQINFVDEKFLNLTSSSTYHSMFLKILVCGFFYTGNINMENYTSVGLGGSNRSILWRVRPDLSATISSYTSQISQSTGVPFSTLSSNKIAIAFGTVRTQFNAANFYSDSDTNGGASWLPQPFAEYITTQTDEYVLHSQYKMPLVEAGQQWDYFPANPIQYATGGFTLTEDKGGPHWGILA